MFRVGDYVWAAGLPRKDGPVVIEEVRPDGDFVVFSLLDCYRFLIAGDLTLASQKDVARAMRQLPDRLSPTKREDCHPDHRKQWDAADRYAAGDPP